MKKTLSYFKKKIRSFIDKFHNKKLENMLGIALQDISAILDNVKNIAPQVNPLSSQIQSVENNLNHQIQSVENNLNHQIQNVENNLVYYQTRSHFLLKNLIKLQNIKIKYKKGVLHVVDKIYECGGVESRLLRLSQNIVDTPFYFATNYIYGEFHYTNNHVGDIFQFNYSDPMIVDQLLGLALDLNVTSVEFHFKDIDNIDYIKIKEVLNYHNIKLGCTIHTPFIKNHYNMPINELFKIFDYVIAISNEIAHLYKALDNIHVIGHPIPVQKKIKSVVTNNKAIIISRLDPDKFDSLVCAIEFCLLNNINFDIAGKAIVSQEGVRLLKEKFPNILENKFLGEVNVLEFLKKNNYMFVCGMGQCILEAASIGLPVMISGYDGKIFGFIENSYIEKVAFSNYTGRNCDSLANEIINQQLQDVRESRIEKFIIKDYFLYHNDPEIISKTYLNLVK